jgi:UDP-2,3-diacylglucosamine pyrophosphatase LpxH
LHFSVASDTHVGAGDNRQDLTLEMIKQIADPENNFDYFFSLGDLVENGSSRSQWQEALTDMSPIISSIPAGFVPGNHDTLFRGLDFYHYYCYPDGIVTKSGSGLYYRIDNGPIHFLVLDLEWSAETYSAAQAAWLEDQLKTIPDNDWKIVMSHGFYYSSGYIFHGRQWYDNPETIQALTPLFEKYKVDLVFSGHNHQMELLQHSGVTYVVCGAFGGLPDPTRKYISPASLWYTTGQFGFMDVKISSQQADLTFCDPDLNVLKNYTLQKP